MASSRENVSGVRHCEGCAVADPVVPTRSSEPSKPRDVRRALANPQDVVK